MHGETYHAQRELRVSFWLELDVGDSDGTG